MMAVWQVLMLAAIPPVVALWFARMQERQR